MIKNKANSHNDIRWRGKIMIHQYLLMLKRPWQIIFSKHGHALCVPSNMSYNITLLSPWIGASLHNLLLTVDYSRSGTSWLWGHLIKGNAATTSPSFSCEAHPWILAIMLWRSHELHRKTCGFSGGNPGW